MSGDHKKCFSCGTGYYSGVSLNCPNCGSTLTLQVVLFTAVLVIVLTFIAGLAFGAIALTYFARKKSWHWVSYIGSLIVAGFSIYYVAENWDMEWYTVAIIFLNLFGILYALFNLFRKWFKWIVLGSVLLGLIIAFWPEPDPVVYYVESPNGVIHRLTGFPESESVFIIHQSLGEVFLRDSPEGNKINSVKVNQALMIDSLIYNGSFGMMDDTPFEGWCHVYVENNKEIKGWLYQLDITETTFDDIEAAIELSIKTKDDSPIHYSTEGDTEIDIITEEEEVDAIEEPSSLVINENLYYEIEDPDGWTNLRDTINGNIIRKIYSNDRFLIIKEEGDWCEIFFEDFTSGFIHKSRVRVVN